jgi:hypothetical protein
MVVASVAVAAVDPPPDTLAVFISRDAALAATLTVTIIDG